ncbi:hypothetical protein BH09PAT3_BH09PAT3_4380 [soil metagenome]
MGIYRPLIERAQSGRKESNVTPSDRIVTLPTAVGSLRVPLALKAAKMIAHGEKGATPLVMAMWATDTIDGYIAGLVDRKLPGSGLGSSEFGAKADVAYDVLSGVIIGSALMVGPNVSKTAKLAVGVALGKDLSKTARYMGMNRDFKEALRQGELPITNLDIPVNFDGKESTVEQGMALTLATATNDFENPYVRATLSGLAVAHAIAGNIHGERAAEDYDTKFSYMLGHIATGNYPSVQQTV